MTVLGLAVSEVPRVTALRVECPNHVTYGCGDL